MHVDPYAPTEREHARPEHDSCPDGSRALRLLTQSDDDTPSVFERLRRIERLIGLSVVLLAAPLWWMAWMMHAQKALQ